MLTGRPFSSLPASGSTWRPSERSSERRSSWLARASGSSVRRPSRTGISSLGERLLTEPSKARASAPAKSRSAQADQAASFVRKARTGEGIRPPRLRWGRSTPPRPCTQAGLTRRGSLALAFMPGLGRGDQPSLAGPTRAAVDRPRRATTRRHGLFQASAPARRLPLPHIAWPATSCLLDSQGL